MAKGSIQVEGLDELENLLLKISNEGPKRAIAAMAKGAKKIQSLAQQMAPVDTGGLEEAIKVDITPNRDAAGRFQSQEVTVYVDQEMRNAEGRAVGSYAYQVHESLTPYGPKGLGAKSRAKQDAQSVVVGGGYLERAAEEVQDEVIGDVRDAVKRYL